MENDVLFDFVQSWKTTEWDKWLYLRDTTMTT